MATAAEDSTFPAIRKNPSFVAEEIEWDAHFPIIDLVDHEVSRQIQLESNPRIVQFEKFTPGLIYNRNIKVRNTSSKIQRTYVSNPMTKWFAIKVNKEHNLLPGLDMTILLKFKPDKDRYYYDRLRISFQSGESLFIPIHAFPIPPSVNFPTHLELRKSSIGEVSMYTIPITCSSPIELKFRLEFQPHLSCCQVAPVKGILYSGIPVEVILRFKPEFSASFQQNLNLTINNIEMGPLTCKVIYQYEKTKREKVKNLTKSTELQRGTKLLRGKKISPIRNVSSKKRESQNEDLMTIESTHSYSFLNISNIYNIKSGQMKEKQFIDVQKEIQEDAKSNQSKFKIKLGSLPLSTEERKMISKYREICWEKFQENEMLVDKDGLLRRKCLYGKKGPLLDFQDKLIHYKFNFSITNEWPARLLSLRRFRNGVKKIMTRFRANRRLTIFRQLLKDEKGIGSTAAPKESETKFSMCLDNIKPQSSSKLFYCPQDYKNILWPGLKSSDFVPLTFGDLFPFKPVPEKEPLLHEILGYKLQDIYEAGAMYSPIAPKPSYPEPDCALERVLAFVEARERFAHTKTTLPKELFNTPMIDPRKYFVKHRNAYREIPEIIPLPITVESEQEYALFPINTWQPKETVKTVSSLEELAKNVGKCSNIAVAAQFSDDLPETKSLVPIKSQFKFELPRTDENVIEEIKVDDKADAKINSDNVRQVQAIASTTVEEILTCDYQTHTSSSPSHN